MPTTNSSLYRLDRDLTREQVIATLAALPAQLGALLSRHPVATLTHSSADGEWTPIESCRHIRDIVQVYGMRFKWMILQDDPFLPNYDENRWAAGSPDGAADIDALLDEVKVWRAETIRLLRSRAPEDWQRTGRHEVLGAVELEAYIRHELAHEEQHLSQLAQSLPAT